MCWYEAQPIHRGATPGRLVSLNTSSFVRVYRVMASSAWVSRALAADPATMLMDERFGAIDAIRDAALPVMLAWTRIVTVTIIGIGAIAVLITAGSIAAAALAGLANILLRALERRAQRDLRRRVMRGSRVCANYGTVGKISAEMRSIVSMP